MKYDGTIIPIQLQHNKQTATFQDVSKHVGVLDNNLFPYQVNYHIEHHLHPAIPHYNLLACHREMQQRGLLYDAEVRHIFTTAKLVSADPIPA